MAILVSAGALASCATDAPAAQAAQMAPTGHRAQAGGSTVIVTLGTAGGPRPRTDRAQTANLLIVNGTPYLIDVGANAVRRIQQSGTDFLQISRVFITHGHSDHTLGLPTLLATAWEFQRREPIEIIGPPGTAKLTHDALQFLSTNSEIRRSEGNPSPIEEIVKARDVAPGQVYEDKNVRVLAVENTHFNFGTSSPLSAKIKSYSYKFVTPDETVVFTGDTGPSPALERLATGADVLVTEIGAAEELVAFYKANGTWQRKTEEEQREWLRHQHEEHLSAEAVGALAANAGVKRVILTHLIPVANEKVVYADLKRRVQAVYKGDVVLAADLMRF
ncbi:MAG: MBL fold metallo-hydrolase [Gemmatimonadaceae bacterium]